MTLEIPGAARTVNHLALDGSRTSLQHRSAGNQSNRSRAAEERGLESGCAPRQEKTQELRLSCLTLPRKVNNQCESCVLLAFNLKRSWVVMRIDGSFGKKCHSNPTRKRGRTGPENPIAIGLRLRVGLRVVLTPMRHFIPNEPSIRITT